jgi:glycosyltransferase involved in cell wall biosynthesis
MNKKKSPFITVSIPVFNGHDYISDCINSVLKQSYTSFELLIIDNCSTDDTKSIVLDYDDHRIRYIRNNSNIGAFNNFNKCIKMATGDYFVLLPHDDLLLSGALEQFVLALKNEKIGFVYSAMQVIDENGDILHTKINHLSNKSFTSEEAIMDIIKNFMPIQCAMVRTEILKKLGGFDLKYSLSTDIHLWSRIIFEGWGSYYINTPKSCLRAHPQQGQRAFQNPNLGILSQHWGKKLDESFWIENSFNYLQLKVWGFIFEGMKKRGYDYIYAKKKFINMFVRSHIRFILLSVFALNKFALLLELKLFYKVLKQYTFRQIVIAYIFVILSEIWIRLFIKIKSLFTRNKEVIKQ